MNLQEGIGVAVGVVVGLAFLVVFLVVGLAVNTGGGFGRGGPVPAQRPSVSIPKNITVPTGTTPLPTTTTP